jgi:hypothetical protein
MTYQKPQLTVLDSAVSVIQNQGMSKFSGSNDSNDKPTTAAYEADE